PLALNRYLFTSSPFFGLSSGSKAFGQSAICGDLHCGSELSDRRRRLSVSLRLRRCYRLFLQCKFFPTTEAPSRVRPSTANVTASHHCAARFPFGPPHLVAWHRPRELVFRP